jgi:lysophospholipase L1-like esterase
MTRYVALGDSISVGMGDPLPEAEGGGWRGWPALLATGLPAPEMHNFAVLGAQTAEVLTMRMPDPGAMLGIPQALARPLARRMHAVNDALDKVAAEYGTLHFDAAADPEAYQRRNWSVDRLHPNERGHRLIARRFHALLEEAGFPVAPAPDQEPASPPPTRREELTWMATKGTSWVVKRSTDLVPALLALAVRDWFTTARAR